MDIFDRFTAKAYVMSYHSPSEPLVHHTSYNRSDPIIEPMLQSVPDPFDAYGPPQSEDQIFSILAPLSIMTQPAPSSSTPSPLTGTPERGASESLPSSLGNNKVTTWLPTSSAVNGSTIFPTEATAWADVHSSSPPSTPPRSVSPQHNPHLSRRHSVPAGPSHRKAESKLRSVLSVIDEGRGSRHEGSTSSIGNDNGSCKGNDTTPPAPTSEPQNLNGTAPPAPQPHTSSDTTNVEPEPGHPAHSWSFTYGQSPSEYENNSNSSTPRNSMLFTSLPPPLPTESPSSNGTSTNDHQDPDDQLRLAHTSI